MRQGWIKQVDDKDHYEILVGTTDHTDYHGPTAHITYDKDFFYISTDDYEGTAMLNIEALPYLRRALAKIAKAIK